MDCLSLLIGALFGHRNLLSSCWLACVLSGSNFAVKLRHASGPGPSPESVLLSVSREVSWFADATRVEDFSHPVFSASHARVPAVHFSVEPGAQGDSGFLPAELSPEPCLLCISSTSPSTQCHKLVRSSDVFTSTRWLPDHLLHITSIRESFNDTPLP